MNQPEETLEDNKPGKSGKQEMFLKIMGAVMLISNLFLIAFSLNDGGWGAVSTGLIYNPLVNTSCGIIILIAIPYLQRRDPKFSMFFQLIGGILVPILCCIVTFVVCTAIARGC